MRAELLEKEKQLTLTPKKLALLRPVFILQFIDMRKLVEGGGKQQQLIPLSGVSKSREKQAVQTGESRLLHTLVNREKARTEHPTKIICCPLSPLRSVRHPHFLLSPAKCR